MSNDQSGWEISGTFYPHVGHDGLLHGDHALMREVTGLTLSELDSGEDPEATETAWIAVAVWHQNLELRRDAVRKFIEHLPLDAAKAVGFEKKKETAEAPLDGSLSADSGKPSSSSDSTPADDSSASASPNTTKSSEDTTLEPSIRNGSGGQPSATGVTSPPTISAPSTSAAA